MTPTVVVCTVDGPDVNLCVASLAYYAPEYPVLIAYRGDPPDLPVTPDTVTLVEQPPGTDTYGAAQNFAIEHVDGPAFVLLNDDTVLMPWTLQMLTVDAMNVGERLGMIGARSNYVSGDQHILRNPHGHRCPTQRISPVCALVVREAFEAAGGFEPCTWFSDDVLSYDMRAHGYRMWVSRAYVHHIGQRSSGGISEANNRKLYLEGARWVLQHRPDAADTLGIRLGKTA